jgi:uncharacterized protein (TIGR02231 family)
MTDNPLLEAPIAEVTVFQDGARVVRKGRLAVPAGSPTVVLADLPPSVDTASVRVTARGKGVTLRDVEVRRDYRTEPVHEHTGRLRAEVDRCKDAVRQLEDEDAAEQARLDYLGHLSEAAATALARAVGYGRADHDQLTRMADELAGGTAAALTSRRSIAGRRRTAKRDLDAAERRLAEAESAGATTAAVVEIGTTLEVAEGTDVALEVSYHVTGAAWRPLYDLRLQGEKLAVAYLAEVTQHTGEDWPEVPLTLSTTRRGRHSDLPELQPWYIGRAQPPPARHAFAARARAPMPMAPQAAGGVMASAEFGLDEELEEAIELFATAEESGAALVYRVPVPVPVPSDGAPHKTTVGRIELDAQLDHLTVPPMAQEAYLRATVTNTSEMLFLAGSAQVFHEEEYVGPTHLDTTAPGEEIEVQLGVDDRIRVERELRKRATSKALLGGTRTVDVAYEVTVENHRGRPARVTVKDHIPVSRDGDVKVRVRETVPKPTEQDELGELTWELAMEPGGKASVRFSFTVEHPAGVVVAGL